VQKEYQQKHMQAFAAAASRGARRVSDIAKEYETAHPNATPSQVLSYVSGIIAPQQQQQPQQPSYQYQAVEPLTTPNYYWSSSSYPATSSGESPRIITVNIDCLL